MKKIISIVVSIIIVLLLGLFITVAFFPNIYINSGKIIKFQDNINSRYDGIELNLNAKTFKASYDSGLFNKTHYKLKLKDASIKINGTFLLNHLPPDMIGHYSNISDKTSIVLAFSNLNLIYGPFDKFLAIKDIRGIKITSYNNNTETDDIVKGTLNKIKTNKINLSSLLKESYNNLKDAYTSILIQNPNYRISINDIDIQLRNDISKNNIVVAKVNFNQKTTEDIAKLMNNLSDKDIEEVLKSGKEQQVSQISVNNAKMIAKYDNKTNNYTLNSMMFSSSFSPQEAGFMSYKITLNAEGLQLSSTGNDKASKMYSVIDGLKDLNGSFIIENISPKLAKNYINLVKYSRGNAVNTANFQELAGHLSALMTSIKEAKPKIHLDINPLKHKLLEAYVDGDLAFTENANIPTGTIFVKTTNLDKLENKLAENNLLTDNNKRLLNTIKGYLKQTDDNFYATTIEIRNQIPYIFINGQPLTGGQTQPSLPNNPPAH
jgi:hypothetical protein